MPRARNMFRVDVSFGTDGVCWIEWWCTIQRHNWTIHWQNFDPTKCQLSAQSKTPPMGIRTVTYSDGLGLVVLKVLVPPVPSGLCHQPSIAHESVIVLSLCHIYWPKERISLLWASRGAITESHLWHWWWWTSSSTSACCYFIVSMFILVSRLFSLIVITSQPIPTHTRTRPRPKSQASPSRSSTRWDTNFSSVLTPECDCSSSLLSATAITWHTCTRTMQAISDPSTSCAQTRSYLTLSNTHSARGHSRCSHPTLTCYLWWKIYMW